MLVKCVDFGCLYSEDFSSYDNNNDVEFPSAMTFIVVTVYTLIHFYLSRTFISTHDCTLSKGHGVSLLASCHFC